MIRSSGLGGKKPRLPTVEATQSKRNGCGFKAGIETTTTIETDLLRIEFVEIMEDTANDQALVIVERVFVFIDTPIFRTSIIVTTIEAIGSQNMLPKQMLARCSCGGSATWVALPRRGAWLVAYLSKSGDEPINILGRCVDVARRAHRGRYTEPL